MEGSIRGHALDLCVRMVVTVGGVGVGGRGVWRDLGSFGVWGKLDANHRAWHVGRGDSEMYVVACTQMHAHIHIYAHTSARR